MRVQALSAAVLILAAAAAVPAEARTPYYSGQSSYTQEDPWCAKQRQNRMLAGAAIGGIAGAVLGNNLAAGGVQSEGSIVGGVVGAASGAAIGRATANCTQTVQSGSQSYNTYNSYTGDAPGYGGSHNAGYGYDDYGLAGAPRGRGEDCRWGTRTLRDPDGRELRESVYMCRGREGVWRAR